jgi:hypothetical protein
MATMPAITTMRALCSTMRFDTRITGAMVGIRLRAALGSTMILVHNSAQNRLTTTALDEKIRRPPLFGQDADGEACNDHQEHNGGGGKLVVVLLHKDSKHNDHAQNRQQNE